MPVRKLKPPESTRTVRLLTVLPIRVSRLTVLLLVVLSASAPLGAQEQENSEAQVAPGIPDASPTAPPITEASDLVVRDFFAPEENSYPEPTADTALLESTPQPVAEVSSAWPWEVSNSGSSWKTKFLPHVRFSTYYDDNIYIQRDHKVSDEIAIASFGLRMGFGSVPDPISVTRELRGVPLIYVDPALDTGNFVLADYTGSLVRFAHNPSQNSFDHDALFKFGWTDTKLTLALTGHYQALTGSDIDVGERVRRNLYATDARAVYALSGKTAVETTVSVAKTEYEGINSALELIHESWLNYQFSPKVNMGPGFGAGLVDFDTGPTQRYEHAQFRGSYAFSPKLSVHGRAGVEFRQTNGGGSQTEPIYAVGTVYAPYDGTTLGLDAYRLVGASATLFGDTFVLRGLAFSVRQRFIQRFYLTLGVSYESVDYLHAISGSSTPRSYDYLLGKVGVTFDISRWCNALVFYNYQSNRSSEPSNSFVDNQAGIEVSFSF